MKVKKFFIFCLMFIFSIKGIAQNNASSPSSHLNQSQLQLFPLNEIRLHKSAFLEAELIDKKYMLELDADRLLAPYLKEAGIPTKAANYPNWENTGLDGHIGGHYLSALANMYAATADTQILHRIHYMVDWLEKCQNKNLNGYISGIPGGKKMWQEISNGKINASSFSLNEKWVPLYNIHKLFAGLIDIYQLTGNGKAKTILLKLSDWFYNCFNSLSDEQLQTILRTEQGGINEALADVSAISGNMKYLQLAKRLSDRKILNPLLAQKDSLNGLHANTQIPKVIGYLRVGSLLGDTAWSNAADFFWHTITANRTISIGGNSVREHFNPATDFSSMIYSKEGPETCNSYNMLKLSKQLFVLHPSAKYLDYYERTMYNHILSSQHPTGGFVYFTPIRPMHYRVYSQPQLSFWCCVGTGMENHGKYGELIYAHKGNDLYINFFIPSVLNWKEKGIKVEQLTNFPYSERTDLKLTLNAPAAFAIRFRYPSWVLEGTLKAWVNNQAVIIKRNTDRYATISRKWKTGDVISLELPMVTKAEYLPDSSAWLSFVRGPIVLAAATDTTALVGLKAGDSRMGHIANGLSYPIEEAPMIVADHTISRTVLQPVNKKHFVYTAANLIYPEKYQNLQLVPFYSLHNTRYMIYWRFASPQQYLEIKKELQQSDDAKLALEAITIDQVIPGEQQPEADHFIKTNNSNTGIYKDRHWRDAKGWFSYLFKDKQKQAVAVRITYYGKETNRKFKILINDSLLKEEVLDGSKGDAFFSIDYPIIASMLTDASGDLNIKLIAANNSMVAGVYDIRIIKKKSDEK